MLWRELAVTQQITLTNSSMFSDVRFRKCIARITDGFYFNKIGFFYSQNEIVVPAVGILFVLMTINAELHKPSKCGYHL